MSSPADSFCLVYVTTSDQQEARALAEALIAERLAACANILGAIQSLYWWDGAVQSEQECSVLFKTRKDLFPQLEQRIKALHSYDCPCIVALPFTDGNASFLQWIDAQTRQS